MLQGWPCFNTNLVNLPCSPWVRGWSARLMFGLGGHGLESRWEPRCFFVPRSRHYELNMFTWNQIFRPVYRKSGAFPTTQFTTVCTTHFIGWRRLLIVISSIIALWLSCGYRSVWLWLINHWFPLTAQSMLTDWLTMPRTSRLNTRTYWRSRKLPLVSRWFFSIVSFSSAWISWLRIIP